MDILLSLPSLMGEESFLWNERRHGAGLRMSFLIEIITIFMISVHLSTQSGFLLIDILFLGAYNAMR